MHRILTLLAFLCSAGSAGLRAQPDPPPGGPGGGDPPVGGSPLDGGLAVLLVLAGLYGLWLGFTWWRQRRQEVPSTLPRSAWRSGAKETE
ncbi:MAG TPA: hypothetical protein P5550_01685 [Bacteroidales bacterium]|nr:hypothetical protein [Bacteroidales bacterium]HRZ76175.1 hypothetical protein [Bacteroidales bacterium]